MTNKQYRVAVVGAAGTWGRYYTRAYAAHPNCTIVGLVDRARERRDAIARRYGVEKVYDDLDGLLAAEVPDIVSAVVPVGQNYPCVTTCARAGVRVVSCEKPISHQLHEADEMIRICREHGTLFGCAQAGWATPYMPEVVEWVRQGHIGRLTCGGDPGRAADRGVGRRLRANRRAAHPHWDGCGMGGRVHLAGGAGVRGGRHSYRGGGCTCVRPLGAERRHRLRGRRP